MPSARITQDGDDLANIPLRILRERLREMIALRNTNAKEVSLASKNSESYVRDILSGRSNNPRMSALHSIAQVLQCDLQYLLGQSDNITAAEGRRGIYPMPILYIAEMGAYRPMLAKLKSSDARTVSADSHPNYPHARHFAVEVRDDSMDRAGIADGMFALCVDFTSARLTVESGEMYVISRTLAAVKHPEISIKRAMVYADRTEYRTESTKEDDTTLTVPTGSQMDDQEAQVEPIGLVYAAQKIFYRKK